MKIRPSLLLAIYAGTMLIVPALARSQSKYWIEFRDKGIVPASFVPRDSVFERTRASLSLAALYRRSRALEEPMDATISIEDAPICSRYLDSVGALGIGICVESKWSNAVSAWLTDSEARRILSFPFVRGVFPVGHASIASVPITPFSRSALSQKGYGLPLSSDTGCGYDPIIYQYGDTNIGSNNRIDLERINVWPLHAMGFDGSGVRLGHLDVGADLSVSSLDSANVLFQYDYVFHDSSVANPQDQHGTETLSTAMGNLPDTLMGPAYHCSVMVGHTENTDYEENIEEDNYADAIEDFEARGVQITTSSLGYFTFDSGQHSYTYADMNGHTAICTQAVERAAKLGVLVVTAMGNGGATSYPYVVAPADADSILACGALDVDDTIAAFSSRGPTSDGRIKPDISAPGVNVWGENPNGTFGLLTGTSFATPLTSGSCCLILQAHPEATAQQIRHAVMMTGNRASDPDTAYGWGELNAYAAAVELGIVIHPMQVWIDTALHICAGIASQYPIENATLTYFGDSDITPQNAVFHLAEDSLIYDCTALINYAALGGTQNVYYQISVQDQSGTTTTYPASGWETLALPVQQGQVTVFPNPTSTVAELNVGSGGNWRMYNSIGGLVAMGSTQGPAAITIYTSTLAAATYYIQFISDSGETKTVPIVVIH